MTLDHLIAVVPDLRATHRRLLDAGFDEAWPPGPFWPQAITSGIALGGANLELVQPEAGVSTARIETVVLAPTNLEEGRIVLNDLGLAFGEREKIEPDPSLLALRGFPPEVAASPQRICTNQLPVEPPYPFFHCCYAPFLKERLAPEGFCQPRGPIVALAVTSPAPEDVRRLFAGHLGPIELDVELGETSEIAEIRFADGSILTAQDL
ncbi:hypothetical protein EON82_00315 [bacterium]|nr:MAG: hypothetical protein EON82_00315 [bacterium]